MSGNSLNISFNFITPESIAFERWDWRNPDEVGIGGSETSHIEMARRLAKRGHKVVSYAPIRPDTPSVDDCGVEWKDVATIASGGLRTDSHTINVVYRAPFAADWFESGKLWLICQDEDYVSWTKGRQQAFTRVVGLCSDHCAHLERYPHLRWRICQSSNGLKTEAIQRALAHGLPRNPKWLFYGSSPDRALIPVLQALQVVREFDPDIELFVAYGFDNIDKVPGVKTDKIRAMLKQPGVHWVGRLPQPTLYELMAQCGLWVYPCCNFRETSCIQSMEAQALGLVPIVSPLWAVKENVMGGEHILGNTYHDPMVQAELVQCILRWANDVEAQINLRLKLMPAALQRFDWENFVTQWEQWAFEDCVPRVHANQFSFQRTHVRDLILNVGCHTDPAGLRAEFGAVNVDIQHHGEPSVVDHIADARNLPLTFKNAFDTIVIGDLLEHFPDPLDVNAILTEAKRCLAFGGRILITCPDDDVENADRILIIKMASDLPYHPHSFRVPLPMLYGWCEAAGLRVIKAERIAYPFTPHFGWGVIAEVK